MSSNTDDRANPAHALGAAMSTSLHFGGPCRRASDAHRWDKSIAEFGTILYSAAGAHACYTISDMKLAVPVCWFFSLLLFTGCATSVKPDAASIAIPKAPVPIPVTVGISQVEQKLNGGFSDLALSVKKSLD